MTVSASLLAAAVVLCAVGGILMLTRPLTRILLGAVVASNGINLFVLSATGSAGREPLLYGVDLAEVTDPLPQAIALTAIVITLATTAFLLSMAYRSHQVTGSDEISDDTEDRLVALRAEFLDRRGELRDRYREARAGDGGADAEQRARYRAARKRLRRRVREERAYQARANDVSGNLWNDILGADPEDYREGRELGSTDAAGRPGPAPARIAGPSNDPEETGREPDSRPGEDSGHPQPDQPDDPGGAGTEGTR